MGQFKWVIKVRQLVTNFLARLSIYSETGNGTRTTIFKCDPIKVRDSNETGKDGKWRYQKVGHLKESGKDQIEIK